MCCIKRQRAKSRFKGLRKHSCSVNVGGWKGNQETWFVFVLCLFIGVVTRFKAQHRETNRSRASSRLYVVGYMLVTWSIKRMFSSQAAWLKSNVQILAATKQRYELFNTSVRPFVRHNFHYVPVIISSWNSQEFRILTPVLTHWWLLNDAQSLQWCRSDALLFFKGHPNNWAFVDCNPFGIH